MPWHKYPDNPTRSAELLRLALPLMSRQAAGVHPLSYAVWYEHVSGRNASLSQAIGELTAGGRQLDEATTVKLFDQHVADPSEGTAERVADGFKRVLADMSESARHASVESARFDDSLASFSQQVGDGQALDAQALQAVLAHTREMRDAVGTLQSRLEASRQEVDRLRAEIDRAREEALVDALTGLPNRRAFDQRVAGALAQPADRDCLLVTDIDHFKRINDTYGHLFGDQVLKAVAHALKSCVASGELAARVGGEEFAILLPGVALQQGAAVAERIRASVAASRIRRKDSQESIGQVTISLGVAQRLPGETAAAWYHRADQALYASKQGGRNRVTLAPGSAPPPAAAAASGSTGAVATA
jgi:diguanylate cyclase